jgi:DNA helicase IV
MNQRDKDSLLIQAKGHIAQIQQLVLAKLKETQSLIKETQAGFGKLSAAETKIQARLLSNNQRRAQELEALHPSPYFIKCEVKFDGETASRIFYFAKFHYSEESIFSWTAPASVIRFENPGRFSYLAPGNETKSGELISKEQYLITDGKIIFMAAEALNYPRELIYQEYFSQHKSSFILPEIIEQMEKVQDQVIRAHYQGSFLISGPAGSGKTTLALHRVAYLLQSPDTAEKLKAENSIVFVQDNSTKEYFSQLLPQLGINNVNITTFDRWALDQLNIFDHKFIVRYGNSEKEADLFEHAKSMALKNVQSIKYKKDIFAVLQQTYFDVFTDGLKSLLLQQKKDKVLDRFDLTLLLQAYINTEGGLKKEEVTHKQLKGGKLKKIYEIKPLKYSVLILDEVQNYLPQQIQVLQDCMDKANSIIYVGDLAQQTRLCTVKNWEDVGETFNEERIIKLAKNYRSTKQILEYISALGYQVNIPEKIKQGPQVQEHQIQTKQEEVNKVQQIVNDNKDVVVGILAKTPEYLEDYKQKLSGDKNAHVLTINEAQGVEFDVVCLVGISQDFFLTEYDNVELNKEKSRINRDLLYVALTRAMNGLEIFGTSKLSELIKKT